MPNPTLLDIPSLAMTPMLAVSNGILSPQDANSVHAAPFELTYWLINLVTLVFFVGIIIVMVYFALKYRRTDDRQHAEHTSHHNTALELSWTLPPLVIVLALFYLGFTGYWKLVTIPDNAYEIQVTAQKWNWLFTHPNGYQSGTLDVPAGKPVKLTMQSLDVLHSLYIPAFRVKKDVVPGRYSAMWFNAIAATPHADDTMPQGAELDALIRDYYRDAAANELKTKSGTTPTEAEVAAQVSALLAKLDEKGKLAAARAALDQKAANHGHQLFCAEFCGQQHSMMLAKVVVHKEGWTAPRPVVGTPAEEGEKLFKSRGCVTCHAIGPGGPTIGPSFANGIFGQPRTWTDGTSGTADENYLRNSFLTPMAKIVTGYQPQMPVIPLSDQQVSNLIAYLKTLGPQQGDADKPADDAKPDAEPATQAEPAAAAPVASALCADEEQKDGEDEQPKDPLDDPKLIEQGKALFQTKICMTCHQTDPAIPAPAGDALKATRFIGKFWGEKRIVTKGPGGEEIEVVFDRPYVEESIAEPMKLIVKGSIPGMAPLPTTPEERTALTAYVKSLSE